MVVMIKIDVIMKKMSIIFAALGLFVAASCSTVEMQPVVEPARDLVPLSILSGEKASQQAALKTTLSGTEVHWTEGDAVAVFDKLNYKNEFPSVAVSGSSARFEGQVENGTTEFYAVYPFSSALSADASNLYVNLPSDQTPVAGTFAEEMNVSVAAGSRTPGEPEVAGLRFRNVCGLIYFTVPARLSAVSEVVFKAENRALAGQLTIAKSDVTTVAAVSSGSNSVKMSGDFAAGSTFYFVVAPGKVQGFSITVKTKNGATYTNSSVKSFALASGAMKNLGTIDFKSQPTAVAEHTYENGILTGTKVTFNLGLPEKMGEYVTDFSAVMTNSNNNKCREINSRSNVSGAINMAVVNGMTYIPQGDYTLTYSYFMNGVKEEKSFTVNVPKPTFTVSAFAETSYSRYLNGDPSANTYFSTAYEVKNISYKVSISDNVLSQIALSACSGAVTAVSGGTKYASTDDAYVNKSKSTFYSNTGVTNVPVGEYSVSASATFDGVTVNSPSSKIHVTGLPYKAPTMVESDWDLSGWNCEYNNGAIQLGGVSGSGEASATSAMTFHIPENIPIKINTNVTVRAYLYTGLWGSWDDRWCETTFSVSVNGSKIISQHSNSQDNNNTGKNYDLSGTSTFTLSGSSIKMNSSYTMAGPWCKVHNLYILYN